MAEKDNERLSLILELSKAKCNSTYNSNDRLTYLHIYNGSFEENPVDFSVFSELNELFIYNCELTDIKKLNLPLSLKSLTVNGAFKIFDCSFLSNLESLMLTECRADEYLFPQSLLFLNFNEVTENIPRDLSNLTNLSDLSFINNKLTTIDDFKLPENLKTLHLEFNPIAEADLSSCKKLKSIVTHSLEFPSLAALKLPQGIESISVAYNESFTDPDASFFTGLQNYSVDWCAIEEVKPLHIPQSVVYLSFFWG